METSTGELFWVGVLFICMGPPLGLLMAGIGFGYLRRSTAVQSWPVAMGTVVATTVRAHTDSDGTSYRPYVIYQYEVLGQVYQADNLDIFDLQGGYSGTGIGAAEQRAAQYPPGRSVQVHYDAQKPERSVLEIRTPVFMIVFLFAMMLFMGCGFTGGGLAMIFWPMIGG